MSNATISQIKVGSTTYDICDASARDFMDNNFKFVELTNTNSISIAAVTAGTMSAFQNVYLGKVTDSYAITHNITLEDINSEGFRCISILSMTTNVAGMVFGSVNLWHTSTYPYPVLRVGTRYQALSYAVGDFKVRTLYFKPSSWSWPTWSSTTTS